MKVHLKPAPPFQKAMEHLAANLFSAAFQPRDAAQGQDSHEPVDRESEPNISTDQELCDRRVTIHLYDLAIEAFSRFELKCTNNADIAFVGFLALRNLLTNEQSHKQELKLHVGSL